jgi:ABC-2 type transport system ATP-binding protein
MIEINHLVKSFGDFYALEDVSFKAEQGEIVGFLGRNGAGKSTTLNILTGYLSCDSGSATICGVDILEKPIEAKKHIGYLPEQPPLYLDMTVDEYINFVYELKGVTLPRVPHLNEICSVVKIGEVRKRLIKNLSKGYKQRVGIAQALIGNPEVVVFDEPTIGLDPKQLVEIRNLIRNLGKKHTVVFSTHILQEVQAVCDRVVIIDKGKIVADEKTENIAHVITKSARYKVVISGPVKEITAAIKSISGVTYVEALAEREGDANAFIIENSPGIDIRKKLFFTLATAGWAILYLEPLGATIEDIFLNLIKD